MNAKLHPTMTLFVLTIASSSNFLVVAGVAVLLSNTTRAQAPAISPGAAPKTPTGKMTSSGLWLCDRVSTLR